MTGPLTPVEDVVAVIMASLRPTQPVSLHLAEAWGAVAAEDVSSPRDLPPFDNSAMDGYAVRAADVEAPATLRIIGAAYAGRPHSATVRPGEAVEIATGAVLPDGADTVLRAEAVQRDGDRIRVAHPVATGRDVRRVGEDVRTGERILSAGQRLGAGQLAALAGVGFSRVSVRRPRVTVVVTGDEIAGSEADGAQIPDALGLPIVHAMRADGADADLVGPVGDDDRALAEALSRAAAAADLVVTVGGVSVGPRDRVAAAVAAVGTVTRWTVAVRPGKPLAHGRIGGAAVLCLPGNPAAALAAHELFVRPAVAVLAGGRPAPRSTTAHLARAAVGARGRIHLIRAHVEVRDGLLLAEPLDAAGAGAVGALAAANAWIVLPPEVERLPAGDPVTVRPMAGHVLLT